MKHRRRESIGERAASLALAALMLFACLPFAASPQAHADATVLEVGSFDALVSLVRQSQTDAFEGRTIVLTADLDLTGSNMDAAMQELGHLSFGSSSVPFKGTFDGQGHAITGLDYNRALFVPAADTGLFAQTQGATIKNLDMRDAYVGADFRGGVLVGLAQDTRIENVTLINCTSSVTPANNAISLITNAGLAGGVLAGEVNNSVLYNCEVRGGGAINTSTAGVTALGGEGLYLGGLVGTASGSTIEYCRVTPQVDSAGTGSSPTYTRVSNKYDIAVGAVSGQAVYAGGIAGQIAGGTAVLDSFSTADCYTYCATYVSVGAGNVGYVGGIAAATYGSSCTIARSHYAGNLHSQQYNAVLVIPVIQKNVNLAGIVEKVGDSVSVTNAYYKPSASNEAGVTKKITAVGSSTSGASYGPQTDDRYRDRTFWEGRGFDLAGGTARSSAYDANHVNTWTMDFNLGIPVHGTSVKAGLDFPGAGSVSIGASALAPAGQGTSDPAAFAVEGFLPSETSLSFTAATNAKDPASAGSADNGGYRFCGWYREAGVDVNYVSPETGFYPGIVAKGNLVSTDAALTSAFAGNDLFVAHFQAQVLFHDVEGGAIDKTTGAASADASDDWYDYAAALPAVPAPANTGSGASHVSASAKLIGWASTPYMGTGGGWPAVTSTELADLKATGALYLAGDTVRKPLDLYPVYADYSSNIVTVFEGNEQDGDDRTSMREGVGATSVAADTDEDGNPVYSIAVTGVGTDGAFPDGYRFLGWYETRDGVDVRVSREQAYVLPANVDLTQQHTYTARFSYRVQYWAKAQYQNAGNYNNASTVFAARWDRYQAPFTVLAAPAYMRETFAFWTTAGHGNTVAYTSANPVVTPLDVYAHNTSTSGGNVGYSAFITTDFPGSVTFTQDAPSANNLKTLTATPLTGYNFVCWTGESDALISYKETKSTPAFAVGLLLPTSNYVFSARMTADVDFHAKSGAVMPTTRRYQEPVFQSSNSTYAYPYLYTKNGAAGVSNTSAASPSDASMQVAGYRFLGWMDRNTVAAGGMTQGEWDYVFDVADDASCTSDPARALPYVVDGAATVTRAMDLYPVYAKYDIVTTTNVARAGVPAGSGIAVPPDPALVTTDNGDGTLTATVTADVSTPVTSGSATLYELASLTLERAGGATVTLSPTTTGGNVFTYVVGPGPRSTFVANYTPLAVVYHLDASQTDVRLKNMGDLLGPGPQPLFDLDAIDAAAGGVHVFVGWSDANPGADGYAIGDASTALVGPSDPVSRPTELWPVYRPIGATAASNIDAELAAGGIDPASVRSVGRADGGLVVQAGDAAGYQFAGWYRDYADAANPGTLVSAAATFSLDASQAFDSVTYTAVYEAVHELRYHDTHGAVLDTVGVRDDEPRSFVETVEVPVYDDDGNQTSTKQVESIIDSGAYQAIVQQLDNECQQAPQRETFNAWQWVKSDGTVVAWDDFYRTAISEDMDLYPVTWRCAALDANGASFTPNLTWQIDFNTAASGGTGDAAVPVRAYLRAPYVQSSLWVTVDQAAYGTGGTFDTTPQQDVAVALYNSVDASAANIGRETTDVDGMASFTFTGSLTLKKVCASGTASGRTFALSVTGASTSSGTGIIGEETRTVLITCARQSDGSIGGSSTISLPYGEYTVAEDAAWAWRATPAFTVLDLGATVPREDTKVTVSSSGATVTCTNTRDNNQWIDGDERRTNVFG